MIIVIIIVFWYSLQSNMKKSACATVWKKILKIFILTLYFGLTKN